ncbi:MAG TPA: DUF6049 family protein [Actinomycetota bacterium]|nr:DUF6049 family protein [Actinomycetota bacterium]
MSWPPRGARRACRALLAAVLIVAVIGVPARAQTTGDVDLYLVEQPVWHEPDDPFGIRLRVTNRSSATLEGFRLLVRVFDRARSRSQFEENFEIDAARFEASSHSVEFPDTDVPAGASEIVELSSPVSDLGSLATTTTAGIYPLTVTVTDAGGFTRLGDLTTQLIYLPTDVERPLHIVPVWQLVDLPSRTRRGYEADDDRGSAAEDAVREGGWARGVADALTSAPGERLRLGFAPLPRLVEEIADLSDGYQRVVDGSSEAVPPAAPVPRSARATLEAFRAVVARRAVQPVALPYSLPDLPSLAELEQTTAQLNATQAVFGEALGISPGNRWLFPPAGRLDASTLESLRLSDAAARTFVSPGVIETPAFEGAVSCHEDFVGITHTCPVVLSTPSGGARGYLLDEGLQTRFDAVAQAPRDRLALQRLFAETAMIWAELPGTAERVVTLSAPPLWHPPPWIARLFVRTLARAPWLRSVTPRQGLHLGIGAVERELVPQAPPLRSAPDADFVEAVEAAGDVVESFARMNPPLPMIQRLRRDVLTAQSRLWWGNDESVERGAAFAQDARAEVEDELAKITIGGRQDITLTSRTGDIPLDLVNDAGYPVSLEVTLETSDRDLRVSDPLIRRSFDPGASPLPLRATARSSGIFPVGVTVRSPDGFTVYQTTIRIRSTEFNEIALAVTLGALGFLVLFYAGRRIRRRGAPDDTDPA